MALWKETPNPTAPAPVATAASPPPDRALERKERPFPEAPPPAAAVHRPLPRERAEGGESVIAATLSIEGKIVGSGNVRMAGRFKGDVRIDGNFNIEHGAQLTGQVLAGVVVVGGELQGNIESAKRVEVMEGGVIVGDVKAGAITVAAGARMRGHVEFGWDDEKSLKVAASGPTGVAVGKS